MAPAKANFKPGGAESLFPPAADAVSKGGIVLTQEPPLALELRPNCEYCDRDLPPDSALARICSYECTFCVDCVATKLDNVCPNCGGGFVPRPIRPAREWRPGLSVAKRPASAKRVHLSYTHEDIAAHSERIKTIDPRHR